MASAFIFIDYMTVAINKGNMAQRYNCGSKEIRNRDRKNIINYGMLVTMIHVYSIRLQYYMPPKLRTMSTKP